MKIYRFDHAFLPTGWAADVTVSVDDSGIINNVSSGSSSQSTPPLDDARVESISAPVIPGLANLHSHAFQRAMAGRAERHSAGKQDFWSWRTLMYEVANAVDPDCLQAIAAQAYLEMLKAGYTSVGEFHYLHNDRDGGSYDDPTEMSGRIVAAAQTAGIAVTHLPVFYAQGGFGGQPPLVEQKRFTQTIDGYLDMVDRLRRLERHSRDIRIGAAPHSLRAVTPESLSAIIAGVQADDTMTPIHMHVAEQTKEVDDCLEWCGQRPVEWLLNHAPVDGRWCLIHATHMDASETRQLAASDAVAGLCPTTEANLGDGVFPLTDYVNAGGKFGVGSDSNVEINAAGELRLLDYGQRLTRQRRIPIATATGSAGARMLTAALDGGAQALGRETGRIAEGYRADLVTLSPASAHIDPTDPTDMIDGALYAAPTLPVRDVMVGGHWRIRDGQHPGEEAILTRFREAVRSTVDRS
ncbi:formimidoylglutamate deiminase [Fodinicurvata sp. EGI_FJ10296]|uniref:formimidoylglutamate deiminase n=1 Tax=Fodinicurvata sp. EGI_FJ10296 TaxID=3231908 RepID=UPI003455394D